MNKETQQLINELVSVFNRYQKIFCLSAMIQILETVKNILISSTIKTMEQTNIENEKYDERINPNKTLDFSWLEH